MIGLYFIFKVFSFDSLSSFKSLQVCNTSIEKLATVTWTGILLRMRLLFILHSRIHNFAIIWHASCIHVARTRPLKLKSKCSGNYVFLIINIYVFHQKILVKY